MVTTMNKSNKYTKHPVTIEAIQWTGDNKKAVKEFCPIVRFRHNGDRDELLIRTLEGMMMASVDDWIIKGVQGEYYPCKPDIFAATYKTEREYREWMEETMGRNQTTNGGL